MIDSSIPGASMSVNLVDRSVEYARVAHESIRQRRRLPFKDLSHPCPIMAETPHLHDGQ